MADAESDANPRVPRFDTVLRGYNPRQVNERVTRLSFDLSHATKSRDEAVAKVAELTKALGSSQQQLQDSREQLNRITVNPTSTEAMSERQRLMWQLAEEEIAEFKHNADDYDR
jgi:ABC-type transporter Mla subunit MlaD